MAYKPDRLKENVPGAYYVTCDCIDCDTCREIAPASFARNDGIGLSVVHRQPETDEEQALAREAMEGCPADAIGNDGTE